MGEDIVDEGFMAESDTEALDEWGNPALADIVPLEADIEEEEEDSGFFDPESLIN